MLNSEKLEKYDTYIIVCVFAIFIMTIVSSVRRFTISDYRFDIFKLFLIIQNNDDLPF